ncbi:MAG: hypothetical protein KDD24_02640 [Flavobacteriales bacterium]|nr:hypothetical protein [Flavobacteriales bacterium]MCB9173522.1 hypothetical protein [Flavobacteriales bacterium]
MQFEGKIQELSKTTKMLLVCFLITLSFGFYTGLLFINENTNSTFNGVEEHYLGNEDDENAEVMKFKKSKKDIVTMVHNHVLSLSIIFLLLGGLLLLTNLSPILKKILIVEPFISLLLTFGGIWVMWSGVLWFKYIIMLSGILMTATFTASVLIILFQLLRKK